MIFPVNFDYKIMTYILHQLSWGHNQTPKVASDMQRIAYRSSFIPCRNQKKLLTPRVASAVNRYECFMENENMIRTFWGCKPCKKTTTLILIKTLLVFIKIWRLWIRSKIHRISISKKWNKLWQKLLDQQNMKSIN